MHKLDPIERLPDGSLFRLTPGQLRSVRGLTKRCCNFLDGDCLLLDGVCPQHISRSLRHGHSRPLRQDKILPRLRQGHPPSPESKVRPQTAVGRRQFGGEKPLNCKHSRTTKAARQYDFPRSREIEFYLST